MNILTFSTHEGYQYNLCKTGHNFDILESDKLGGVKGWDYRQRPLPKNVNIISEVENYNKYDLILCQKISDWNLVKDIDKKKIILFHVAWSRNWDVPEEVDTKGRDDLIKTMGDCYKVFILSSKQKTWNSFDKKSVVINHGVDLNDYGDEYLGNTPRVLRACHFFRDRDWWCGYNKFIKIVDKLPYLILGNNPNTDNSIYPESFDEYKKYFSDYRVYFNSTTNDSYPFSMLDAFAMGMPVVSTEVKSENKYIENGVNGFMSDDDKFIYDAITLMLADRKKARDIGKRGKEIITNHFNIEVFKNKWNEIFELAKD